MKSLVNYLVNLMHPVSLRKENAAWSMIDTESVSTREDAIKLLDLAIEDIASMSARLVAYEKALIAIADVADSPLAAPADVVEFGVRNKIENFAKATYETGTSDFKAALYSRLKQ